MVKRKRTWPEEAPGPLPQSCVSSAKDSDVLAVLPGITRKIAACGACRKQKVSHSIWERFGWIDFNVLRSNVT